MILLCLYTWPTQSLISLLAPSAPSLRLRRLSRLYNHATKWLWTYSTPALVWLQSILGLRAFNAKLSQALRSLRHRYHLLRLRLRSQHTEPQPEQTLQTPPTFQDKHTHKVPKSSWTLIPLQQLSTACTQTSVSRTRRSKTSITRNHLRHGHQPHCSRHQLSYLCVRALLAILLVWHTFFSL